MVRKNVMKKRIFSAVTAFVMSMSSVPVLASVIYANTASTTAYAEGEFTIPDLDITSKGIPDLDCFKFVADMTLGINLGNTFDATDDDGYVSNELDIESAWVGVKTTKEMIDSMKSAGFNTLRLPVSWHNHVDEDFNISEAWLNRVQEVVDYAMANEMYVILNIHHDNEKEFMYPDSEHLDNSIDYVSSIWTQLADKFKEYDDHLIFEALNEPRLKGNTTYEWWFNPNAEECKDAQECINQLNQKFVDIVRASGGNNATRYLMMPAYCATIDAASSDLFKLPEDTVENKLIVDIHAYTPYNFALQAPADSGSVDTFDINGSGASEISALMDKIYLNLVSKNIPVVIGEFGARNKNENTQARVDYATYYIAAARARGITCCWWDNHCFDTNAGEAFGILDRKDCTWEYADIVKGLVKYSGNENEVVIPPSSGDETENGERVAGIVSTAEGSSNITFGEAMGSTVELEVEVAEGCNYANGALCFNSQIDGVNYWSACQFEATASGKIIVDLSNPNMIQNCDVLDEDGNPTPVEDEDIKNAVIENIMSQKSTIAQYWYAADSTWATLEPASDYIEVTNAYIVKSATDTTEPDDLDGLLCDANCDGKVAVADAVAVSAYVSNATINELTEQGIDNSDVHSRGNGINASDALMIQQYATGIITSFGDDVAVVVDEMLTGKELSEYSLGRAALIGYTTASDDILWCGQSGSGMKFDFSGDALTVTILGDSVSENKYDVNNHARVGIFVNGERVIDDMLDETEKTYTVVSSDVKDAEIRIVKLSEALSSTFAIKNIGYSGTVAKSDTNGLIEFIGDSITCGYGVDDPVKENGFSTKTEDVTKTYAYKTAEALGFDCSMVSFSGYGVISGYTSGDKASALTVPQYYNKLGHSNVATFNGQNLDDIDWNPTESQKPDIVVVNLGTNDYNYTKSDATKNEEFKQGYIDFLTQIRESNPDALIICTCGIMGGDLYPVIEQAVEEFNDNSVTCLEFDVQNINTDGVCADWHPSEATHEKASQKLVDFIISFIPEID